MSKWLHCDSCDKPVYKLIGKEQAEYSLDDFEPRLFTADNCCENPDHWPRNKNIKKPVRHLVYQYIY